MIVPANSFFYGKQGSIDLWIWGIEGGTVSNHWAHILRNIKAVGTKPLPLNSAPATTKMPSLLGLISFSINYFLKYKIKVKL